MSRRHFSFHWRVAEMSRGAREAGEHTLIWSATGMRSGVYFLRLVAGDASRSVTLLVE